MSSVLDVKEESVRGKVLLYKVAVWSISISLKRCSLIPYTDENGRERCYSTSAAVKNSTKSRDRLV